MRGILSGAGLIAAALLAACGAAAPEPSEDNLKEALARRGGMADLSAKLGDMRDHEAGPAAAPSPPHARLDNRLVRSRDFH